VDKEGGKPALGGQQNKVVHVWTLPMKEAVVVAIQLLLLL